MSRSRLAELGALVVVLVALGYCGWFRIAGGSWEQVESPSMGVAAPVGTLLWIEPVTPSALAVGDIVSFHRPGTVGGATYTHRVTAVHAGGSFESAGDLSGADPWVVGPTDVVGRVSRAWPGIGRIVESAPILLIGGFLILGAGRWLPRRQRLPISMVGASITVAVALIVHHPLSGVEVIGIEPGPGATTVRFVATGLFPLQITGDAAPILLHAGEAGSVRSSPDSAGEYPIAMHPDVPPWLWVLLIGSAFAPAVGSALPRARARTALTPTG